MAKAFGEVFSMIGKDPTLDRHIREVGKKELADPDFTIERSAKVSKAVVSLHLWLKGIV